MKVVLFFFSLLSVVCSFSQQRQIDSLITLAQKEKTDSARVLRLYEVAKKYAPGSEQEMDRYFKEGMLLAQVKKLVILYQQGMNDQAVQYLLKGKYEKALAITDVAVAAGIKNKLADEFARTYFVKTNIYYALKSYTESNRFAKMAFAMYKQTNNTLRLGNVCQSIGNNHYALGEFDEALKYYYDASAFYEQAKAFDMQAQILSNLGVINVNLKNFDIAEGFYNKALAIYIKGKNANGELLTNYNIGALLHGQKKYSEASVVSEQTLRLARSLKNKKIETSSLSVLASCFERLNDTLKADYYFNELFKTLEAYDDSESLLIAYNNYAMFLSGLDQIDKAIVYQYKAITIAKTDVGLKKYLHSLFSTLSTFYNYKKEYALAFAYKDSQQIYKEAIINETSNNKLLELQTKYETQQKEGKIILLSKSDSIKSLQILAQQSAIDRNLYSIAQQQLAMAEGSILLFTQSEVILQNKLDASLKEEKITALTKEGLQKQLALQQQEALAKQKKQVLYSLLGGTVLTSLLVLLVVYNRNRKKQADAEALAQRVLLQSVLETEEKERTRIAKDLHDGIVQDLTAIKLDIQSAVQTAPELMQAQLQTIFKAVDVAAKDVREISYQMMPLTLKELGLLKAMEELLNRSLIKNNIKYHFDHFGIDERLTDKIEVTVYRICQELINNTIKHSGATEVSLLLQLRNNVLQLTYEDNGRGFNASTTQKGIGLNSLGSRVEMVKGSLEFDSSAETGITAYIRIPVS